MIFSELYISYYSELVWFAKEFVLFEENVMIRGTIDNLPDKQCMEIFLLSKFEKY